MKKLIPHLPFFILLFLIVFLRIFHIATTPLTMHIDEAALGLNAWSIANFGTDRYGNPMPVCPSNFYGEQSAFYTYFSALLIKFFGLNLYTLRLPAAFMGIVTVIFGALLIRERWGTRGFYAGLALLGFSPYFIMSSRFALDCNAMLGVLTVAVYCLIRVVKKAESEPDRKLYGRFALTGILFGLTLYTYIIAAIVAAVFCSLFGLYYLFYKKDGRLLRLKQLFFLTLPLCIMAVPLILVVCVNYFDLEPIVTPLFSVPKMFVNRTEEVTLSSFSLPGKLRGLLHTLTSDGKYGSSDQYWTMYPWSVPFIFIGGIYSFYEAVNAFRRRTIVPALYILLILFAEVLLFLLCGQYIYHINGIFTALAYLCVSGILCALDFFRRTRESARKSQWPGMALAGVLVCLYGISFAGFAKDYFGGDTTVAFQVFGGADDALALLPEDKKDRDIYIMDEVGEFYFLTNPLPPSEFSALCDELGYITDYENIHFRHPGTYRADDVYISNRSSGLYQVLSDASITGIEFNRLETEHYCVFYCQ